MRSARRLAGVALAGLGIALGTPPARAAEPSPLPDTLLFTVAVADHPGTFGRIGGVAAGPDGSIYVMDLDRHRVARFDPSGRAIGMWGGRGHRQGQFVFTTGSLEYMVGLGIAVAPDGTVFVADPGNHRVQRFTANGSFLGAWGHRGDAPGLMDTPIDVAATADGVFVQDAGNRRIQRFTVDGSFVRTWPIAPTCDPSSNIPLGLGAAPDGSLVAGVYSTDGTRITAGCVQRYDADGTPRGQWTVQTPGQMPYPVPRDVAVAADGDVFVSVGDLEVQRFRPDGRIVDVWPAEVRGLAVDRDGTLIGGGTARIERFTPDGTAAPIASSAPPGYGTIESPSSVDVDGVGNVYVADAGLHRVQWFNPAGVLVGAWGSPGTAIGHLDAPGGLAVTADGSTVFVADTGNHRIQWFMWTATPSAGFPSPSQGAWGVRGSGPGQFERPTGVALGDDGTVYVVDAGNRRVQRFSRSGAFLGAFGGPGSGATTLGEPVDVAVGAYGEVYVSDAASHRVQMFGETGADHGAIGFHGGGDGQFVAPAGIGSDRWPRHELREVRLLVADRRTNLLQRFGADHVPLMAWGGAGGDGAGNDRGLLDEPVDVAVAPSGLVYVAEAANRRVQVFDAAGAFVGTLGSRALRPPAEPASAQQAEGTFRPVDVAAGRDGSFYVASEDQRVLHFSAVGSYLGQWGYRRYDGTHGVFWKVQSLAVAADGTVHVLDTLEARVQSFSPTGVFRRAWDVWSDRLVDPNASLTDLAVGPDGAVYVAGERPSRVWRFDASGAPLGTWSVGKEHGPWDVAVGPASDVYATGWVRGFAVDRFTSAGDRLGGWGRKGAGPGEFGGDCVEWYGMCRAGPLAIDGAGLVYVADPSLGRIQRFTRDGRFVDALAPDRSRYDWSFPLGRFDIDASSPTPHLIALTADTAGGVQVYGSDPPDAWRAEYFGNAWLAERPLRIAYLPALDLAWDASSTPLVGVLGRGVSARFQRYLTVAGGVYDLTFTAKGGTRLWVDDKLVLDRWDAPEAGATITVPLLAGRYDLQVEVRSTEPEGAVALSWARTGDLAGAYLPAVLRR